MSRLWRRSDVDLGDLFVEGGIGKDGDHPMLFRVVAIADSPTVVLRPADERDGEDDVHFVISSPLFAEWAKVQSYGPNADGDT